MPRTISQARFAQALVAHILVAALAPALLATAPVPAQPIEGEMDVEPLLIDKIYVSEPTPDPAPPQLQRTSPQDKAKARALERAAIKAINAGELERADALLEQQRLLEPRSHIVYYNLACVRSMMGFSGEAADLLGMSVERGFDDIHQLVRDPHLSAMRDEDLYTQLIDHWPAILEARRDANLANVRTWLDGRYEELRDDGLRIELVSAHDQTSTRQSLDELRDLSDWGQQHIFGDILSNEYAPYDPWVIVVLPNKADFIKWSVGVLGASAQQGFSRVGGAYVHDNKHLVAQDLGATLRHEFFHVIHWRDMTRRNQSHPIWIQEGLCSLVEDYDIIEQSITPAASWRTNIVKRQLRAGRLEPITKLASYSQATFSSKRPLARYAHARTVFLYLAQMNKLRAWYERYTETYDQDPSGISALEHALGKPINTIEKDYRAWVKQLPMVPETGSDLSATLGVEIESGEGDGPIIVSITPEARRRTNLRLFDRITSIAAQPTRDLNELIRRLGAYGPGSTIELGVRRGRIHETVQATLKKR